MAGKRICLWLLLFSFLLFATKGQTSLTFSPLHSEFKISPGKSKKEVVLIGNDSPHPVYVKADLKSWSLDDEGVLFLPEKDQFFYSCKEWIKLEDSEFHLSPGERRSVQYKISVPKKTQPGHYWAAIAFETGAQGDLKGRMDRIIIKEKIMSGVFIQVGKVEPEGKIIDLSVGGKRGDRQLDILVQNEGSFYFWIKGDVEVADERGMKILERDLPEEIILPGSKRELKILLNDKLNSGRYSVTCRIQLPTKKALQFKKDIVIE